MVAPASLGIILKLSLYNAINQLMLFSRMKFLITFTTIFLLVCACNNKGTQPGANLPHQKFDATKWKIKEGDDYPFRENMLKDLVENVTLKGIKHDQLIQLLGRPDRVDSSYLFYRVFQKRIDFFPLSTKTLVIKLTKDSTVEWRKIHG